MPTADVAVETPPAQANRHFERARRRFAERNWTEAIEELEKAIRIEPRYPAAHTLLARAALRQDDHGLADRHLQTAVNQRPDDVAVQQLLGELAWQDNKSADAIRHFRLALRAQNADPARPETVLARLSLAIALRKEGYLTAAADQLQAYLDAVGSPGPQMQNHDELSRVIELYLGTAAGLLAEIHSELGRHEEAVRAYRRAVDEAPDDARLKHRLARATAKAGRADDAVRLVLDLLRNDASASDVLQLLEEVCTLSGRPSRFDVEITRIAETASDAGLLARVADALLERGLKPAAIAALERALSKDAQDADAAYRLANLHLDDKHPRRFLNVIARTLKERPDTVSRADDALQNAQSRVDTWPGLLEAAARAAAESDQDAVGHYLLGRALVLDARAEQAADAFRQAVRIDPQFGPASVGLVEALMAGKQWEEAVGAAGEAVDRGVKSAALFHAKGRAHAALDETEDAIAAYRESLRIDRESADVLLDMAELARDRNDLRQVEALYDRIISEVDRKCVPAREALIRLYLRTNRFDLARQLFREFATLALKGPAVRRCRARIKLRTRDDLPVKRRWQRYRKELEEILEDHPEDVETHLDLAGSHLDSHQDYETCFKIAQQAVQISPDHRAARKLLADSAVRMLDYAKAETAIRSLLKDRPRHIEYHAYLVELARDRADFDTAIERLRGILERDDLGRMRQVWVANLVDTLIKAGRADEAIRLSKAGLDEEPEDARRRAMHLSVLLGAGKKDDAARLAQEWWADDPTSNNRRVVFVVCLRDAGRTIEAQQRVLDWLEDDPDDPALNEWLVKMLWAGRDFDAALDIARVGAEDPRHREHYLTLVGQSLEAAGRFDDAADHYQKRIVAAGELSEKNFLAVEDLYKSTLRALLSGERYLDAERVIRNLSRPFLMRRRVAPGQRDSLANGIPGMLIVIYQRTDRIDKAIDLLEEEHRVAPASPGACNNLGYTLVDMGRELDRAEKLIRYAVGMAPTVAAYLDSLGWVLYKRGKYDEAVTYLDRAIRQAADEDPEILDHMGDVHYRKGDTVAAKGFWQRSGDTLKAVEGDIPPPDVEKRQLADRVSAKLAALEAGTAVPVAPIGEAPPTSRPSTQPATDGEGA